MWKGREAVKMVSSQPCWYWLGWYTRKAQKMDICYLCVCMYVCVRMCVQWGLVKSCAAAGGNPFQAYSLLNTSAADDGMEK